MLMFCFAKTLVGEDGTVIVAVNSDSSITRLKGSSRPINSFESRFIMLEGIKYIDKIIMFDEDTPIKLIKSESPDFIIKGIDYFNKEHEIVGTGVSEVKIFDKMTHYRIVDTTNGTIEIELDISDISTSAIIERIKNL